MKFITYNNSISHISTTKRIAFTLFFIFYSVSVVAAKPATVIENGVLSFVENTLLTQVDEFTTITIRELDPRIQIPVCNNRFEFTAVNYNANSPSFSVKASCPDTQWFTFVNVAITQSQAVVVANNALSPGDLLDSNDLRVDDIDKNRLRGSTFANTKTLQGARLKRRVREGTIITNNMLCFVCKGDQVTISASTQGLVLKTSGVALEDGNLGDTIKIENSATDKEIIARVISNREVRVNI